MIVLACFPFLKYFATCLNPREFTKVIHLCLSLDKLSLDLLEGSVPSFVDALGGVEFN